MSINIIGIDLAKEVFHLHGVDSQGRPLMKLRVYRDEVIHKLACMKPCRVVMEACSGSNYWAREIEKHGHNVQLIAPQYVKPFVLRNKNDWKDAEAITVAARQPTMRYVPRRNVEQQDLQSLHRIRERLVSARTALVNEARGLLHEYGIVIPKGRRAFTRYFLEVIDKQSTKLTSASRDFLGDLWTEYCALNDRIEKYEIKLKNFSRANPVCKRLMQVPGVGFISATAVVALARDVSVFKNGREFAAWLGLTPKEHSTGGKQRLGGISKRGDCYTRKLLVHGARITLRYIKKRSDRQGAWAKDLLMRKGMNRSAVALANKNARTIWALINYDQEYKAFPIAA